MSSTATAANRLPSSTRYEFQRPLDTDTLGTVYRALDRRTGQLVAIKVIKPRLSENPALHRQLAQEFVTAAGLDHPNIVRALAAENDGEVGYLVYELVEAGSLGARVQQHGRLPEDAALRVVSQVAQALHYAHDREVVHRALNPDRILTLPDGKAKLTGFGLGRDFKKELRDDAPPAVGLDTLHFVAPELFADGKTVDRRCDVYSLAAVLYCTITGQLPYDGKSPQSVLSKKQQRRLVSARSLVPGTSEPVETTIKAALDPDPDRRPPSALELVKALTGRRRLKEETGALPVAKQASGIRGVERRATVRFILRVGGAALVDPDLHTGGESEERWPLVVRDVSAGGIGILLARRFESGTEVSIELGGAAGDLSRLPAVVVRVQADRGGHWVHGCVFASPLADDQLLALLKLV
jgi:serine/threonine protein kinase